MSHFEWTDATIEISCPECNTDVTGVDAMMSHIIEFHPNYTPVEAANYARVWADSAFEQREEEDVAYAEQRKLDKGIEEYERQKDEGVL